LPSKWVLTCRAIPLIHPSTANGSASILSEVQSRKRSADAYRRARIKCGVDSPAIRSQNTRSRFAPHFVQLGISEIGLNRRAVCSGPRFREQPAREQRFQSNLTLLAPERRREEKGMLSAIQTHLAKELFHDTSSTTHVLQSCVVEEVSWKKLLCEMEFTANSFPRR